ncbi:MAG: hypothetical protein QW197_01950 [Candidatus Aenigmatarchaeota archaeon]
MIPIRTLIIIILIVIGLLFLILIIFTLFSGKGISEILYNFCSITLGRIIGDFFCESIAKGI